MSTSLLCRHTPLSAGAASAPSACTRAAIRGQWRRDDALGKRRFRLEAALTSVGIVVIVVALRGLIVTFGEAAEAHVRAP